MSTASVTGHSSLEGSGGVRYFNGESEDHREYRRWKLWLSNKFMTLDKLPKSSRGSYLFTLLSGKALECVEHVPVEEYQKEGGEDLLIRLLDARFPERDKSDEMGDCINEALNLRVKDGETLRAWISRAPEVFDRCERKTPSEVP